MANIYKYLVLIAGMTIIFNLAGLPTGAGLLMEKAGIDLINNPENISLSNLQLIIIGVFAAASVGGIVVGFITKTSPTNFLIVGYATLLLSFVADMIIIVNYSFANYEAWIGWIVLTIMLPLSIGYGHAIMDWWSNK
jgi:hypothetical protein